MISLAAARSAPWPMPGVRITRPCALLTATYDIQRGHLIAFFGSRLAETDNSTWDGAALATLCLTTIQGSMILARSDRDAQAMDQSIDGPPRLLKSALGDA